MKKGLSLIEILIVITIFSVLGIIVTRSIILTLQGSKKSENLIVVRENLDYAVGVVERQIRNANSVPVCPNLDSQVINYKDQNGVDASFSCVNIGQPDAYVASGSGRLTSSEVAVTDCSFTCSPGDVTNPPYVDVSLGAKSATTTGAQGSVVTANTKIYLRNY